MSFFTGAIAGGLAGAILSGGKPKSSIKDRSVLFETKANINKLKERILNEVLEISKVHLYYYFFPRLFM